MHRFFVSCEVGQDAVLIRGEQAHQITHVLRLKTGDRIILVNGAGWEYDVEISGTSGELVQGKVTRKTLCKNEPRLKITLYQALLKTDKFEFVLQKGVELGVSAFVPFICERCVLKNPGESRITRWNKITREAAEQSERAVIPLVQPVVSFREACDAAGKSPSVLLWEEERGKSLGSVLRSDAFIRSHRINVFVGPEGGFPGTEVEYARSRGIISAGLGCRTLRAETAGLAAISAIMYEAGEFG